MAKKCQWCKIKEDYHYWRDLPSTNHQFLVIMANNFHQQLKIPQKFIVCFKEKLSTWCTLIGPNENTWKVMFVGDLMKFSHGWEKFVSDHGIEVNDILVFHYAGDSSFKVSIFNGENCCEKEGSHFASNTSSSSQNVTCSSSLHFKRAGDNNGLGTSTPVAAPPPAPNPTPAAAPAPATAAAAVGSSQKPIVVDEDDEGTYNANDQDHDHDHDHESEYDTATTIDLSEEDYQTESEYQPAVWRRRTRARLYYSTTEKTSRTRICYVFNQREPTEEEKERAVEKATRFMNTKRYTERENKIPSPPMLQITLRPTHVYRGFMLTLPKKWAIEHMVHGSQDVKLQVGDRSWIVGYRLTKSHNTVVHYFNPNWKRFVLDNNLEEHDSCVFELIQKGCLSVFNVYIFRAIDEIVPLTRSSFRP
ncbi:B3 domain-containing protein REM16-like [Chenopodium quinoa]|uniref:B3 domain-containing protein REM16-like n=1 Tax=Chenopodium quinoa TaxID=63459 RepID=UPI000B77BCAD|nr:B3 domain-containing protein REM16-like [Chenopodium quinoa]